MGDLDQTPATIDELARIAAHPVLVELLQQIQATSSEEERRALSRKLVDRSYLAAKDVPLPNSLRVSMRIFHDPDEPLPPFENIDATLGPYRAETTEIVTTFASLPSNPGERDDHYRPRPKPPRPDLTHCVSMGGGVSAIGSVTSCYSVGG